MKALSAQEKCANLYDVEAALAALELAVPDAKSDPTNAVFVNRPDRISTYLDERQRLVRQGLGADEVILRMGAFRRAASVRGTHTQSTPSLSTHTDTSLSVQSSAKPSISQRALAALERPAPSKSIKRHFIDESTVADWFKRLASIPDAKVYAAHLRLSPAIQAAAMAQAEVADWLRRRVNRYLKDALGFAPPIILAAGIESKGEPSLHAHIVLSVHASSLPAVEAALKAAGGEWASRRSRNRQLVLKPATTAGAAVYALRNAEEARRSNLVSGKTIVASRWSNIPVGH